MHFINILAVFLSATVLKAGAAPVIEDTAALEAAFAAPNANITELLCIHGHTVLAGVPLPTSAYDKVFSAGSVECKTSWTSPTYTEIVAA